MKKLLLLTAATLLVLACPAQDALTGDELRRATTMLVEAAGKLEKLPLTVELAPENARGLKAPQNAGIIVIPDKRLSLDKAERPKPDEKGAPIPAGHLWLLGLEPKVAGGVTAKGGLRLVKVAGRDREYELAHFTLGIHRSDKKEFELVVYGQGAEPLLRIPMAAIKGESASPVEISGRKEGEDTGVVTLTFLGRLKAEIPMTARPN